VRRSNAERDRSRPGKAFDCVFYIRTAVVYEAATGLNALLGVRGQAKRDPALEYQAKVTTRAGSTPKAPSSLRSAGALHGAVRISSSVLFCVTWSQSPPHTGAPWARISVPSTGSSTRVRPTA